VTAQRQQEGALPWLVRIFASRSITIYGREFKFALTYYRLHFLLFIFASWFGALLLWLLEHGSTDVSFTDALFISTSGLTETGLATVDISKFREVSQVALMFIVILGGAVLGSLMPIFIRGLMIDEASEHLQMRILSDVSLETRREAIREVKRLTLGYLIGNYIFGWIVIGSYVQNNPIFQERGVHPWFFSLFVSISAFNNAGFSLFADNLAPLVGDSRTLLMLAYLIMAGNVAFPLFFWLWVRVLHVVYRMLNWQDKLRIYRHLLQYPRECHTHLFPNNVIRWLFFMLLITTFGELFIFLEQEVKLPELAHLNHWQVLCAGWFTAVTTRTAGFNVLDIATLSPAMIVIFIVLMYLSAYPIAVSIRSTDAQVKTTKEAEAKNMMVDDLFWLFTPWIFICFIENVHPADGLETDYKQPLKTLFEISSAMGTVGLSLSAPHIVTSFSALLKPLSKWIMILVMLIGRHRGLPEGLDSILGLTE
jgi:Trk-type K+ transport system membrane component